LIEPRLDPLRSALAKLDPAAAAALWRPQVAKSAKSAVPQPRTAKAAHGAPEAVALVDQLVRARKQPPPSPTSTERNVEPVVFDKMAAA
jgi:hypothetical protein